MQTSVTVVSPDIQGRPQCTQTNVIVINPDIQGRSQDTTDEHRALLLSRSNVYVLSHSSNSSMNAASNDLQVAT